MTVQSKSISKSKEVNFIWKGEANEVYLLGSFDNWESKRKMDQGNNEYTKSLHLPENKYEYKFIVDGQWKHDPNSKITPDNLGGFNNVVLVTSDATQTSKGVFEIAKEKQKVASLPVMWNQLKKVSIPKFSGDVRQYETWMATFNACIENSNVSDQLKLLHLRKCLSGEALNVIDGLGYSMSAYKIAKERIERKYGGEKRNLNLYLEE